MWVALTSIGKSLKRSSSDGTLTVRSAPCSCPHSISQAILWLATVHWGETPQSFEQDHFSESFTRDNKVV